MKRQVTEAAGNKAAENVGMADASSALSYFASWKMTPIPCPSGTTSTRTVGAEFDIDGVPIESLDAPGDTWWRLDLGYVDHVESLRNLAAGTTPFFAFESPPLHCLEKAEFESKKRGVADAEIG